MARGGIGLPTGYDALRRAVVEVLLGQPMLATSGSVSAGSGASSGGPGYPPEVDDSRRIAALVDMARDGDAEAFGSLYDHYSPAVYRFVYYRVSAQALAEDIVSDTFFRALRSMSKFQWQGTDFGAWLMTIARNLTVDHYKSGRTRLETPTDDFGANGQSTPGPEEEVLAGLTNEVLHEALDALPAEQQECIVLRFFSEASIAETAKVLGRSEGAVKQLQLRAVRNLAKLMPVGLGPQ
ncbi:MAG: sigma-70 family RNA polymerase sigma factor [Nocardioidaceae bacterium]|nr:sigma-70 family RNA polymerase sigma factor [Nocardioidaceae bacterium]